MKMNCRLLCVLLALALCCCRSGVSATGKSVSGPKVPGLKFVPVDVPVVLCKAEANKLRWRFPGETAWKDCAGELESHSYQIVTTPAGAGHGTEYTIAGGGYTQGVEEEIIIDATYGGKESDITTSICLTAATNYGSSEKLTACTENTGETAFFVMNYTTNQSSHVYKKWTTSSGYNNWVQQQQAAKTSSAAVAPKTPVAQEETQAGTPGVTGPSGAPSTETPEENAAGKSGAAQGGNAVEGASRPETPETPAVPEGNVKAKEALGPAAASSGTAKSSARGRTAGGADSSGVITAWVQAPLVLLLPLVVSAVV
ncbi:mucin-like glycoprotein [Trypanosoma conorhini]|uniref:Mucin-like glycoprotein n=1 Tax=Trypanosoma conorhini TaxID=83891 RepID=A0A422P8U6_9TRYP|nr:mucin-like glycoprotein [Trypanosoma conorhini]RNF14112.1 mucin-like glycoprotein [Trypanosoma conorhini]